MAIRQFSLVAVCFGLVFSGFLNPALRGIERDESPPGAATATADGLVRAAMVADLQGDVVRRNRLLKESLQIAPDLAPARWQSGHVRVGEEWLKVVDAERRTAEDGRVFQYRDLRERLAGTGEGQLYLARWCRKMKLDDQERLHWAHVVRFDPRHKEARSRLRLKEYRGMLLTREQISQYEEAVDQYEEAMEYWLPRMRRWRADLTGHDAVASDRAERELQAINDPAAIPALEQVFSTESEALGLRVVEVLARLDQQASTDSLVRHAVLSDFGQVRRAATRELSQRSLFAYMPTLLGSLQAPIELTYFVKTFATDAQYGFNVEREQPNSILSLSRVHRQPLYDVVIRMLRPEARPRTGYVARDLRGIARMGQAVAKENVTSAALNERIYPVLQQATGQEIGQAPQEWWQWWQDYNELEAGKQKPVFRRSEYSNSRQIVVSCSCFLPGTKVWTETGAVRIEDVRVGDRVLSQDPDSGEIAYKLVWDTTVREPSPTLRLGVGDEEIVGTLGHPLWSVGSGWRMTKELKVGDRLYSLRGGVPIEYVEEGAESSAYNLVVADFNTYFVGKHRILVHDNSARWPAQGPLPGFHSEKGNLQARGTERPALNVTNGR